MSQWIDLLDRLNIKPIPNLAGTREPTANDDLDDGYGIGSTWIWGDRSWVCTYAVVANARWIETTSTAGVHGLDEHTDVDTTTVAPTDGQALVWDDGAGKWEPGSVAAGGGGSAGDMDCVEAGFLTEGGSAWWEVPTSDTWTDAPLDVTEIETDSAVLDHDGTSNTGRITIKESGYYLVYYTCGMNNHYGIGLRIRKNDTTTIPTSESPNNQNLGNDKDAGMISWQGVHYFDASGTDPYIYLQCWWPSEQSQQSAIDAGQVSLGAIRLATSAATTLDALTDTDLTGVLNQDVLAYNSTSGNWEPTTASTPGAHATTHLSGNSDELDHDGLLNFVAAEHVDWAGVSAGTIDPSNIAVVTASADGLAPTFPDNTTDYLRADGTWNTPPGGSSSTLDDVITGGTPDNDVNVPIANPIILRDNAADLTPLTVAKTSATQLTPSILVESTFSNEGIDVNFSTDGRKTSVTPTGIIHDGDTSVAGYANGPQTPTTADTDGRDVTYQGGPASGTGDGGDITIQAGQAPGAGTSGVIKVGPSNFYTSAVNLGAADVQSNVVGDLDVGGDITVTGTVDGVDVADHSALHENGGADEISIADLSGLAADAQYAAIQDGGVPETDEGGLAHTLNFGANLAVTGISSGVVTVTSVGGSDATAIHTDASAEISGVTAETTPALDDVLLIESAANSFSKRSVELDDLPGNDIETLDEGTPFTNTTMKYDFVGAGVQVHEDDDVGSPGEFRVQIDGGTAPVDSVFGRFDDVVAAAGDYAATQITNDSGVTGPFLDDALDNLDTDATSLHIDGNLEFTSVTTEKASPIGADLLLLEDSVTGDTQKVQLTNLPVIGGSVDHIVIAAQKASAGTIAIGQVAYIVGWSTGDSVITVELADSDAAGTMPGYGIAKESITDSGSGQLAVSGTVSGFDTSSFAVGDPLYVGGTAGSLTNVKPTGTGLVQHVAICNKSDAATGIVQVVGAGVLNGLPNLAEDNVWMGNASGVPTATALDPSIKTLTLPDSTTISPFGASLVDDLDEVAARTTLGAGSATDVATNTDHTGGDGSDHADVASNTTHRGLTTNPHATDLGNLGTGTLGELNAIVADATLDDVSGERTPPDASVTLAKMADMDTASFIGRDTAATGTPEILSGAEATALLSEFAKDSGAQGVVPASAGGTSAYLRADGTWQTPAGSGDVSAVNSPNANEFARWTTATSIEGRTAAEVMADLPAFSTSSTTQGAVAGSNSVGATYYLNGNGAWTVPAGGSAATLTKSITVEDPVTGETISMFFTTVAITVTQITAVIVGSTSITFNISHGTSRAAVTNDVMTSDDVADSTTTGNITTTGWSDNTIPADSFVCLTTSAASGTPTELHVTVEYTED